jgi:hypothetical protein
MIMKKRMFARIMMSLAFIAFLLVAVVPVCAAEPDANVKGLWLKCPGFPKDAEVLEFTDDKDMDEVEYTRFVESVLTFMIRRQKIEESELQKPDDVPSLVEMWVNNDNEDLSSIKVNTKASEFAELYSYPCAMAEYKSGNNEDTRMNQTLFMFTDVYCFIVEVSVAADSAEDFEGRIHNWFRGLEFID